MTVDPSTRIAVRIGELQVATAADACLVTVGLGSCVGVAVIDPRTGTTGLAHVFLPEPPPTGAKPGAGAGTYARLAVPELVRQVSEGAGGAPVRRLVAVIAGGARMFGGNRPGQDVGDRNATAVRAALAEAGVRVAADETGGTSGRTVYVTGGSQPRVTVRAAGGQEQEVWSAGGPVRGTGTLDRMAA